MPFVDSQRMGIAGASYGGYAVNWMIGHTNRFKAAVSHDGVYNIESMMGATEELWFTEWEMGGEPWSAAARENIAKWSPHRFAPQIKTPTLIITNELDYRVPVDQGLQMFTALRAARRPVGDAGVPRRRALGAEGAEQPLLARAGLRLDEALAGSGASDTVILARRRSRGGYGWVTLADEVLDVSQIDAVRVGHAGAVVVGDVRVDGEDDVRAGKQIGPARIAEAYAALALRRVCGELDEFVRSRDCCSAPAASAHSSAWPGRPDPAGRRRE